jgi:hypothetical protein
MVSDRSLNRKTVDDETNVQMSSIVRVDSAGDYWLINRSLDEALNPPSGAVKGALHKILE